MKRHKTRYPGIYFRVAANGERRYQISYKDSAGRRIFDTVDGNERDAVRQRNQILERMHKGERVVKSNLNLRDLAEDYLRTQTGHLKKSTKDNYAYSLRHWVIPMLGRRKIDEFGVDDVADFIAEMRQEHAAWTIRGCLTPMSRMFQYAVRRGWMAQNPVTALDRTERPKGANRRMRILSTDEIEALLAAARPGSPVYQNGRPTESTISGTFHPLFLTAIFTGLRIGEIVNLRWEHVDLAEGIITVVESKTEAGIRHVAMVPFVVQELAKLSLEDSRGLVFKTKDGGPMKRRNVQRALEQTLVRAGVDHCRFHDLRHTFASILIGQGEDVTYVSDQMGHSSPNVTLSIYAKLFDPKSRMKKAREKMQENFQEVV